MNRRDLIALLGGAATWPVAARAQQQPDRMRRIGVLMGVANDALGQARAKAFQQELERLGWIDGRNVLIQYRWAEGRNERYADIAAEFARLNVDVIVAEATPGTVAAKQATSAIPIVFVGAGDPVGTGLVASLARPGGNITGVSNQTRDLAGKRVELLREIVPGLRVLGILVNILNVSAVAEMREVEAAAATLGLQAVKLEIRRAEDIAPILEAFTGRALALYVVIDALAAANALQINTLALGRILPTMWGARETLETGGLMSYGSDNLDLRRRAADYVDKILRGNKPGDIPVEQPTKFDLVINLRTAKTLGLTIPPSVLAIADEVIE
jgi:putative tryptophan/tyrosine transport system substrate-binding protein